MFSTFESEEWSGSSMLTPEIIRFWRERYRLEIPSEILSLYGDSNGGYIADVEFDEMDAEVRFLTGLAVDPPRHEWSLCMLPVTQLLEFHVEQGMLSENIIEEAEGLVVLSSLHFGYLVFDGNPYRNREQLAVVDLEVGAVQKDFLSVKEFVALVRRSAES